MFLIKRSAFKERKLGHIEPAVVPRMIVRAWQRIQFDQRLALRARLYKGFFLVRERIWKFFSVEAVNKRNQIFPCATELCMFAKSVFVQVSKQIRLCSLPVH